MPAAELTNPNGLWLESHRVGALRPALARELAAVGVLVPRPGWAGAWRLPPGSSADEALAELALALRRLGLCGPWRNELIDLWALPPSEPLTGEAPPSSVALGDDASPFQHRVGRIERAAARVLGLQTQAVHLVGFAPDGRVWLQQRALSKPDDPGLWDTLVGGLVPADESLDLALARESMEEAGLALDGLAHWAWAGAIDLRHATRSGGHPGWVRERVHWARGTLHAGQVPANQDGEVAQFDLVHPADLIERMAAGLLTRTATAILRAALLAPAGSGRQDDSR